MAAGTANGGESLVVAEWLKSVPLLVCFVVLKLFFDRLYGAEVHRIHSWKVLVMLLLPKVARADVLTKFRGVVLLDLVAKWYVGSIIVLCERYPIPPRSKWVVQLAYERGKEVSHAFHGINSLVRTTADWPNHLSLTVFSGDIETAFDTLSLELVEKSLTWWGLPPDIIAALLEENSGQEITVDWEGIAFGGPLTFNRCVRTGGKDSAYLWKIAIVFLFAPLIEAWEKAGMGIEVDGSFYNHVIWSDNIWLPQLEKMLGTVSQVLHTFGMRW